MVEVAVNEEIKKYHDLVRSREQLRRKLETVRDPLSVKKIRFEIARINVAAEKCRRQMELS